MSLEETEREGGSTLRHIISIALGKAYRSRFLFGWYDGMGGAWSGALGSADTFMRR